MIEFVKAQACGNDFLIVEEALARGEHAALAQKICARNTSVGADGVEFLERRDGGFFLRLFNADGSEAELSGNGTRCVAAWLAYREGLESVALGTKGGVKLCRVVRPDGERFLIESGMGVPRVAEKVLEVDGLEVRGAVVNVGNPHFVLFVEGEDFVAHGMSWEELGAKICVHSAFAEGTNVEFVWVMAKDRIAFRIYERGCGPTMSSGTGTCASSAAAIVLRGCARELQAEALGGVQSVRWDEGGEMMLTGPAEIVCVGEVAGL